MDRGAWRATVHAFPKSHTRLSDYHSFTPALQADSLPFEIPEQPGICL